jgi:hypothetical protein
MSEPSAPIGTILRATVDAPVIGDASSDADNCGEVGELVASVIPEALILKYECPIAKSLDLPLRQ